MDTDKIIEFLQKIAAQLGPAGQQAFMVVQQRVLAENIIGVISGIIVLLIAAAFGVFVYKLYRNVKDHEPDDELWAFALWCLVAIPCLLFGLWWFVSSLTNLLSLDYATIERILNLIGSAK